MDSTDCADFMTLYKCDMINFLNPMNHGLNWYSKNGKRSTQIKCLLILTFCRGRLFYYFFFFAYFAARNYN